ncbi:MAG: uroporphyrinogen-III synthase [Candidatus Puniceispirillum sp.]
MTDTTLIIRPQPDADRDVACLARYAVPAVAIPVMQTLTMPVTWPDPGRFQGIVLTSRHAVDQLHAAPDAAAWRDLPVFAVGHATAAAAAAAGFAHIITGPGNGAGLVPVMAAYFGSTPAPDQPLLVWPGAVDIGFDMVAALAPYGIRLDPVVVYQMAPRPDVSDAIRAELATVQDGALVAMSARSVNLWRDAMDAAGRGPDRISLIAGSDTIAAAAGDGWREIFVARHPRRSRLLAIAVMRYRRDARLTAG